MNITLVFFIYGLAFFVMGVTLLLESGRSPLLAEAGVMLPLAIFGLAHGAHEWMEMFLDRSDLLVFQHPAQFGWLRVALLIFSFTALAVFGLRMFHPLQKVSASQKAGWGAALGLYVLLVVLTGQFFSGSYANWLYVDNMVRYLLAFPASLLAAWALWHQASIYQRQDREKLALSFRWTALGFLVYAFTQIIVSPLDFYPANSLNTVSFTLVTGLPIQVIRAACAVVVTFSLIRAIQIVEVERQQQLLNIQVARLEALEQVQKDLVEREALRQELLRHIVIAQEDERARIARELHDEAAQLLTAFSLHLGALRDGSPRSPKIKAQVNQLQNLTRQMSQAIFRLVHDLRPAQLDDLGLVAALQYLVDETRNRFGLETRLQIKGARQRLDPLIETVFFRVAQEALNNVARHAGVKEADLLLSFSGQSVTMTISDRGVGFNPDEKRSPPRGWGLAGMRERAESVGGTLSLQSMPGKGTEVELQVPSSNENLDPIVDQNTEEILMKVPVSLSEQVQKINQMEELNGYHSPDVGRRP